MKKSTRFYILSANVILIMINVFISNSMRGMNSAFHEEDVMALIKEKQTVTENSREKTAIKNYWSAEEVIAQQIEKMLSYKNSPSFTQVINNIEENIIYSRNQAAVLFYLAFAYEQVGNKDKANQYYRRIRDSYLNGKCSLYIFNIPRSAAGDRLYSVSIYEESIMRQAKLNGSLALLNQIKETGAVFGEYGKERFSYRDLINYNLNSVSDPAEMRLSYSQYERLSAAKKYAADFLFAAIDTLDDKNNKKEEAEVRLKGYLADYLHGELDFIKRLAAGLADKYTFKLSYVSMRKSGVLYYYTFRVVNEKIDIEILDDGNNYRVVAVRGSQVKKETVTVNAD
jgi:hypothetical protein